MFDYNLNKNHPITIRFGKLITGFTFPPHLFSATVLSWETFKR